MDHYGNMKDIGEEVTGDKPTVREMNKMKRKSSTNIKDIYRTINEAKETQRT